MEKRTHQYYVGYSDALSDVVNHYLDPNNPAVPYLEKERERMRTEKENYDIDLEPNSLS